MKLIGKKTLNGFKERHPDARSQLESWEAEVEESQWETPHDLKNKYPKASIVGNHKVVFDICGNKYRLLVEVSYKNRMVLIDKIGTHKEYDNWNIN